MLPAKFSCVLTGPAGVPRRFLTYEALTFIGRMGKIREIGGVSGWDKKWIFSFLVLTVLVELDNLGYLDKCDIVDALGE